MLFKNNKPNKSEPKEYTDIQKGFIVLIYALLNDERVSNDVKDEVAKAFKRLNSSEEDDKSDISYYYFRMCELGTVTIKDLYSKKKINQDHISDVCKELNDLLYQYYYTVEGLRDAESIIKSKYMFLNNIKSANEIDSLFSNVPFKHKVLLDNYIKSDFKSMLDSKNVADADTLEIAKVTLKDMMAKLYKELIGKDISL